MECLSYTLGQNETSVTCPGQETAACIGVFILKNGSLVTQVYGIYMYIDQLHLIRRAESGWSLGTRLHEMINRLHKVSVFHNPGIMYVIDY